MPGVQAHGLAHGGVRACCVSLACSPLRPHSVTHSARTVSIALTILATAARCWPVSATAESSASALAALGDQLLPLFAVRVRSHYVFGSFATVRAGVTAPAG